MATVSLLCGAVGALAQNLNPRVLPVQAEAFGKSYSEWAESWWLWAWSIPADVSPLNDPTGASAALGQSGPVWFLAGVLTPGGSVTRTITVPAGKALFFPIVNELWVNFPQLGDNPWSPAQEAYARSVIAEAMNQAHDLSCEVDGRSLENLDGYRTRTEPGEAFMVSVPMNDIWGVVAAGATPGLHGPSVEDGVYVMLAPLTPGRHTIHFAASLGDFFILDVTYHITVTVPRRGHYASEAD